MSLIHRRNINIRNPQTRANRAAKPSEPQFTQRMPGIRTSASRDTEERSLLHVHLGACIVWIDEWPIDLLSLSVLLSLDFLEQNYFQHELKISRIIFKIDVSNKFFFKKDEKKRGIRQVAKKKGDYPNNR